MLQEQLINALQKAAGGQYPTTIRHLQPLRDELGWTPEQLTDVVRSLELDGRLTADYANNSVKQIHLPEYFE